MENKNNYIQIPGFISGVATRYMTKLNIGYTEIHEMDEPDFLPGIVTFAGKKYHSGEYVTYLLDTDARGVRETLEDAANNCELHDLA